MIRHIDHRKMGRGKHGWLDSHFHFSFAGYQNPDNMRFGILRVLNDDIVKPWEGFATHPHSDMEIISYVVRGALGHRDSLGNKSTIHRGHVQYMSAGTGITHSEYSVSDDELRFMQMWILPDRKGHAPNYGDHRFEWEERIGAWLPIASGRGNADSAAPIKINADANVYAAYVLPGGSIGFEIGEDRQAYMVLLEGDATVGDVVMAERDALEIVGQSFSLSTSGGGHLYLIEMAR